MTMIICEDCVRVFEGTRTEARAAHWEPVATKTQWDLDQGPMLCGECVTTLLNGVIAAIKAAGRSEPK